MRNETADNIVLISQEHFIYDIDAKTTDPDLGNNSYLWQIPLTIAVGNTSHISSEAIIWVSNKSEHHRIAALDETSWLLGNINQTGYFRVNYDVRNWRLLIDKLMRNHEPQLAVSPALWPAVPAGECSGVAASSCRSEQHVTPLFVLSVTAPLATFRGPPWNACLRKRRKKRTRENLFSEILQASAASDSEQRSWKVNIADSIERGRMDRRKAQDSEREMHQDITGLLRPQTQMLQTLVDLQVQQSWAQLPLQPVENSILVSLYTPQCIMGQIHTTLHTGEQ
ncbi:Thyrotropin-releasing hormone-degrading ectoenzyme [Chelonia mydas]|uniref:Thyrotropin-releasing hormone-degrading ectoenzyme n=1 Tax=Chelonia mydas TaxID=8469 RepID=M7BTB8_CHEMY|nr:Thyrotropin-releasing hormone-degrading ectoenzyme [Chelonia mydas]